MRFEKCLAALQTRAPFRTTNQPEDPVREFLHAAENTVEFRRAELLLSRNSADIAPQFLKPVVAHRDTEILTGDILDLVSFIENHRMIFGQDATKLFIFDGQVGKKQVMVDDDDVALHGALVHEGHETALEL